MPLFYVECSVIILVSFYQTMWTVRSEYLIFPYVIQMTKNAYLGAVVDGIVSDIQSYGVHIRIKDTDLRFVT